MINLVARSTISFSPSVISCGVKNRRKQGLTLEFVPVSDKVAAIDIVMIALSVRQPFNGGNIVSSAYDKRM